MVSHLGRDSALASSLNSDSEWTLEAHLLANIADQLAWANYQRAGGKGTKPKPIPRPGSDEGIETNRIGTPVLRTREELAEWNERRKRGEW